MKRLRSFALCFLVAYTLFALGVSFHSDDHDRQGHPHCNLCQVAHLSFLQTQSWYYVLEVRSMGILDFAISVPPAIDHDWPHLGRDPPVI